MSIWNQAFIATGTPEKHEKRVRRVLELIVPKKTCTKCFDIYPGMFSGTDGLWISCKSAERIGEETVQKAFSLLSVLFGTKTVAWSYDRTDPRRGLLRRKPSGTSLWEDFRDGEPAILPGLPESGSCRELTLSHPDADFCRELIRTAAQAKKFNLAVWLTEKLKDVIGDASDILLLTAG